MLVQYGDEKITYDQIGNPVSYRGVDMKWQGRQLCSISKENMESSYTYDYAGVRTSKTVNGVTTEYFLNGSQILAERTGSKTKCFFYDQAGTLVGMADSDNKIYYYLYNLQGDVIAIADGSTGELAATYTYDAWGNCTVKNADGYDIGTENPFRYRGYYYDSESGLYYLGSRYYDSEVGRFINADTTDILGVQSDLYDKNLYAYCDNNPVMRRDITGEVWDTALDIAFIAGDIESIVANPANIVGYAELAADVVGLAVPGLSGGGKIVRAVMNSENVLKASKVADIIVDSKKAIKSSRKMGMKIHKTYDPIKKTVAKKYKSVNKSLKKYGSRFRPDAIDFKNRIIYELKPYNRTSYKRALRQANAYAKILGGKWNIVIDMYR